VPGKDADLIFLRLLAEKADDKRKLYDLARDGALQSRWLRSASPPSRAEAEQGRTNPRLPLTVRLAPFLRAFGTGRAHDSCRK
jgi:hypothetical protein